MVETKGYRATDSGVFPTGSNTSELPVLQSKDFVDAQWNVGTSCEVRTTKLHVIKMLTLMNEGSTGHLLQPRSFRRTLVAKSARYAPPLPKRRCLCAQSLTITECRGSHGGGALPTMKHLCECSLRQASVDEAVWPPVLAVSEEWNAPHCTNKIRGNTCDLRRMKLQCVDWCQESVVCAGVQRFK